MKRFKKEENMRKGVILSVVAALSLGLLAGCSGGSSSKTSKEAASKDDVKVWVQFSDETAEGKAWEQVVQNFNKKYKGKYKVVTEYIPRSGSGGGYEDKVNAAITTNSLPDVITLDGPNTAAYAKSKVIAPLDDYLKDNNMEDVLDSIKQQGTYDGKFYAFGYSESNVGIYYNKKMFKEAGIDESSLPTLKKPWTWDEFKAVSKKLKDHFKEAAIDFRLNSNDEMLPYAYMPLIWSNGGRVVNEDGTTTKVIPGVGTFTVAPDGMITFVPEAGFTGVAPTVTIQRVDVNGTVVKANYTATVTPAPVMPIEQHPQASQPELPNTGTGDEFGLFSAAALSILASVGLVASSRKKDDEQEA